MILKELKISGYRPFYEEQTLKIEPDVTVLTGANDVGKSAILNILKQDRGEPSSDDVNEDRTIHFVVDPGDDANLYIVTRFHLTPSYVDIFTDLSEFRNWEVDVHFHVMDSRHTKIETRDENGMETDGVPGFLPVRYFSDLADSERIRSVIPGKKPSETEQTLLNLAFGSSEKWQGIERHNSNIQNRLRDQANERLASALAPLKPDSLDLSLSIDYQSRTEPSFIVALQDGQGGRAGPQLRGAGYQKLIGLMLALMQHVSDPDPKILVFDEPENSLHADAQHALRRVLDYVGQHEHLQVIYATHSPAMINPSRPESLRLIYRDTTEDNVATTRIDNKPYIDGNFQSIRTQLGILPADSLLFSSITVIVEGPSDSRGLNLLLRRLHAEWEDDRYSDLNVLHRLTMFFPAGGFGKFDKWLKFAQSNGVLPILLYDGDRESDAIKMDNDHPDVPVLWFKKDTEFEDIVPRKTYFEALAEIVPGNYDISKDKYDKWDKRANLPQEMMFTKRVNKWLCDVFGTCLDKPQVMAKAIERVDLDEVCMCTIDKLIDEIRKTSLKL